MNRTRLSEADVLRRAAQWADDLFETYSVPTILVRYDTGSGGRRNKSSLVRAEREIWSALQRGDTRIAREVLDRLAAVLADPGLALCDQRESLTEVLSERLRRGEYCFAETEVGEHAVVITVWRE